MGRYRQVPLRNASAAGPPYPVRLRARTSVVPVVLVEVGLAALVERLPTLPGLLGHVAEATRLGYTTEEAREGRQAFNEGREPDFEEYDWYY